MEHEYFIKLAIKEAKKSLKTEDVPIGALLIDNTSKKIIAKAHNVRHYKKDPLGHAELIVIRKASKLKKDWRLLDTTLYVTLEPCLMCLGALINARINCLVYGAHDKRFGALTLYGIDENNLTIM